MTRLQKKCFVFSMGLHGLLAATLIVSAGFSSRPEDSGLQVLSMIPANILDGAGAHGGTPAAAAPRMVMPATEPEIVGRSPISKPKEEEVVRPQTLPPPTQARTRVPPREITAPQHEAAPAQQEAVSASPVAKPSHVIVPTYTPAVGMRMAKRTATASDSGPSSSEAELNRLRQAEKALSNLAEGVQGSGAEKTTVVVPGIGGGGEASAGYNEVVKSLYYRAWVTDDSLNAGPAGPVALIVVERDGTIRSAELITPSGDAALDKSVDRALRRVSKLPAFPEGAKDEERTFRIRFNLDAKRASQ